MNLAEFAQRTHIWTRFRRAIMTFWQPLIMLAVIPTIITLALGLPFVVNFVLVTGPLFGVAAYLAHSRYGVPWLVSVGSVVLLGFFFKLLNLISVIRPIERINGTGVSFVILIAMVILFGAVAYFSEQDNEKVDGGHSGRHGKTGMVTVIVVFIVVGITLGGLSFG